MVRQTWRIASAARPSSSEQVIEILLKNRNTDPSFLSCSLKDLESNLTIRGMDEAAELMAEHLSEGRKIVLVGDYDCDGITSTAQMSLFLREIGHQNFEVVIPSRAEGYGIPERAITQNPDASLFVAMDCGTLDSNAISLARAQGADCIVIDHHEAPGHLLAPATVLINPKQETCPSDFKEFCSAGLTLLFLVSLRRALRGEGVRPKLGGKYLALAAIGTVADLAPLVAGNRILTKNGLSCLNAKTHEPIQRLVELAGLSGKTITSGHVGYYIGPRINAAGRMAEARIAYDLMVADDPDEMVRLAQELNRLNSKRQSEEDVILGEIRNRYASMKPNRRTVVLWDSKWPTGLVGIIASRIQQELHYGPTIVFSVDESTGFARGSARSVSGFDIHSALSHCDDLLVKWGGHKMAAGMTVNMGKIDAFAERFEEIAQMRAPEVFLCKGKVDMELDPGLVSSDLINTLKQLEPHGLGNPLPVFAARQTKVTVQKLFGRDQSHMRLLLNGVAPGVFWRGVAHRSAVGWSDNERQDIVFNAEWDDFYSRPVLNIKDIGRLF